MKYCKVTDCENKSRSHEWCVKHYYRWRRYGDPLIRKTENHGMTSTPEYLTWANMIQRCYSYKHAAYKNYGGRGIRVCDRWRNSFTAFYEDMGQKPGGLTLDRIDNDGNYEPLNCRWATTGEQNLNKRIQKSNTSGYRGVSWNKRMKKWQAKITRDKKVRHLGTFRTKEEAIKVRADAENVAS